MDQGNWRQFMLLLLVGALSVVLIGACSWTGNPYGFIDRSGRLVHEFPDLRELTPSHNGLLYPFSCERALVSYGDRFLFVRKDTSRLSGSFPNARSFSEGLAAVCLFDDPQRWGYIDTEGVMVIKPDFHQAGPFSEGLAAVRILNKETWQFIDKSGSVAIAGPFEDAGKFSCGLAAVRKAGKWGFIDRSGKFVIPPVWHTVGDFHEGVVWLEMNASSATVQTGQRVYMDTRGAALFECAPKDWTKDLFFPHYESEALSFCKAGGYESEEDLFIPFVESGDCFEGLIVRQFGDKFGYCDSHGVMKIAPQFDYAWHFSGGRARVYSRQEQGLYGFIDKAGNVVIHPQYKRAGQFSEGLAAVGDGGMYRYVDSSGQQAVPGAFLNASRFSSGLAGVGEFHPYEF